VLIRTVSRHFSDKPTLFCHCLSLAAAPYGTNRVPDTDTIRYQRLVGCQSVRVCLLFVDRVENMLESVDVTFACAMFPVGGVVLHANPRSSDAERARLL